MSCRRRNFIFSTEYSCLSEIEDDNEREIIEDDIEQFTKQKMMIFYDNIEAKTIFRFCDFEIPYFTWNFIRHHLIIKIFDKQ